MVTPSWGSFQKPNQNLIEDEEKEIEQEIPGEIQDEISPEGEKPQWGNFDNPQTYQGEPSPTENEGWFDYIGRNLITNVSRLGEQVVGRYGNIEKFGKDLLSNNPKLAGPIGWALSEWLGPEKWERLIRGNPAHEQLLPTSEDIKKISQELTKGYTTPKTKGEKKFQEFTEDVGALLSGRTIRNPTPFNVGVNSLLIPAAANAAKEITEELGFGEDKANLVKTIVWTPLTLAANINAPRFASDLMNQGRNGIPNNLNINVPRLQNRLQQVANNPHLLHADPRNVLARQQLAAIERDLANGQNSVRTMMTMYDGINAAKRNRDLFAFNRTDQNFARRAIDLVRDAVRDEIMDSGASFPDALHHWRSGIQSWAVIHQSRAITNWIDSIARGPYAKMLAGPATGLFGITSYAGFKAPIVAGPLGAAVPSSYKTGQVIYRIWNDPNLARYYWQSISAAKRENLPAFLNNYNKLNKKLESSPKKSKKKSNEQIFEEL